MKTTIELPDDLLIDAKATAARRRITLKAMIEHALRREIYQVQRESKSAASFSIDEHGLPVFKGGAKQPVTSEMVYELMDELGI